MHDPLPPPMSCLKFLILLITGFSVMMCCILAYMFFIVQHGTIGGF